MSSSSPFPSSPLSASSLPLSAPTNHSLVPPFVVPPSDRLGFSLRFGLMTGLGWLLVGLVLRSLHIPGFAMGGVTEGMFGTFVTGLVAGLIVGATQWLVLRRYVPDWLWMLTTTAGYGLVMVTLQAWQSVLTAELRNVVLPAFLQGLPNEVMLVTSGLIATLLAAFCTVWLGLAQWLALRPYAQSCWGWTFVPSIAVLLSSALVSSRYLLPLLKLPIDLEPIVLAAGVLGITQAIALCSLRQKPHAWLDDLSALATAPELSRRLTRRAERQMRSCLKQSWSHKPGHRRPLSFFVGADETGTIVTYEPLTPLASQHVTHTPLPDLVTPVHAFDPEGQPRPLARFQVTFLRSGRVRVQSGRGIPLWLLAIGLLALVLGVGVGVACLTRIL